MAKSETMTGAMYDTLIGGLAQAERLVNVSVSSETTIERGALLAGGWDGSSVTVHLATSADTAGDLYIAAEDASSVTALSAYSSGTFNRSAIKLGAGLDVNEFEHRMRLNNIWLTEVK